MHKQALAMVSALTMLFTTLAVFPDNTFNLMGEITASAEETEPQETSVARVTIDGVESFYATLEEAFSSNNSGATVTLLNNMTLTQRLTIPESTDFTLDLAEYNIISTYTILVYGNLTIRGTGSIQSDSNAVTITASGTLTLEGGFFSPAEEYSGVNVFSEDAALYVTGADVVIKTLYANANTTVSLSAGTYTGIMTSGTNTLGKMLCNYGKDSETHYAYFDEDGKPIANILNEKELTGTVTVKECNHDVSVCEYQPIEDTTTHQKTCLACGYAEIHDIIAVKEKEPTCTENGNIAYWKCDDCGTYFSDENGSTEINQSETVISATGHKYSDGKCTVCGTFEDGIGARLAGHSISLDGNIGVNFYMELDERVIADSGAYMQFTLPNNKEAIVYIKDAKTDMIDDKQYYVFSCNVAPKEITDIITAQIITSDKIKGTLYEYSVMEYVNCIFTDTDENGEYTYDEKTRNLVGAMMGYCESARDYFNPESSEPIPDADSYLDKLTADDLVDFEKKITGELPDGIEYYGSSLLLESETTVRHYFKSAKGTAVSAYNFSGYKDGYYYTDITGISAANLGTPQETKIGDWSISYSPMSYAYDVLNSDTASDNLKNLVKALYLYNQAAEAYQQQ